MKSSREIEDEYAVLNAQYMFTLVLQFDTAQMKRCLNSQSLQNLAMLLNTRNAEMTLN